MDDLPEEILEIVFSYLSPYKEYDIASCVCKKWKRILHGMLVKLPGKFEQNLIGGNIEWCKVNEGFQVTTVAPRCEHAVCYSDYTRSLYVFGGKSPGGSGAAGFNDLIRLDLHTLAWKRPIVKGNIPPPKYGCSIESYKRSLILFGGSSLTPTNTLHRGSREFSNDLHVYDIDSGMWTQKSFLPDDSPPALYLPQTCVLADEIDADLDFMLLYGGFKKSGVDSSNKEMWCLLLNSWIWEKQTVIGSVSTNSALDLSKSVICRVKSKTYSSAVLVLTVKPSAYAWLLCKTGFAEWTLQKLQISWGNISPFFHFRLSVPLQIGNTVLLFGDSCPQNYMPESFKISALKIIRSSTESQSPNKRLKKSSNDDLMAVRHNGMALDGFQQYVVAYLLDLSDVETKGTLKCINKLDADNTKLLPTYVGRQAKVTMPAVVGRGEVVLFGHEKLGGQSSMTLFLVRSQKSS